jgi:hypothetical protein
MGQAYARGGRRGLGAGLERSYSGRDASTERALRPAGEASPRSCDLSDEPKLIIDSDWKSQAQAEKEKLAEKAVRQAAGSGGSPRRGLRGLGGHAGHQHAVVPRLRPRPVHRAGDGARSSTPSSTSTSWASSSRRPRATSPRPRRPPWRRPCRSSGWPSSKCSQAVAKAIKEGKIKPAEAGANAKPDGRRRGESSGVAGRSAPRVRAHYTLNRP